MTKRVGVKERVHESFWESGSSTNRVSVHTKVVYSEQTVLYDGPVRSAPPAEPVELIVTKMPEPFIEPLHTGYRDNAKPIVHERPRVYVRWWHRLLCRWLGCDWRVLVTIRNHTHRDDGTPNGSMQCRRCLFRAEVWPAWPEVQAADAFKARQTIPRCEICDSYLDVPCDARKHDMHDSVKDAVHLGGTNDHHRRN